MMPQSTRPPPTGRYCADMSAQDTGVTGRRLAEDLVVVVTGAASGIGEAAARLFAAEGAAHVALADADLGAAAAVAADIAARGASAEAHHLDVTDEDSVEQVLDAVVGRWGRLDAAVNNAGISGTMTPLAELGRADWDRMLAVNLTGVYLCCKHELGHMVPAGRGAIVNTSSGAGLVGVAGLAHYAAAKHGVLGLTKSVAIEHARNGIRVNAICPGTTDTPMIRAFMDDNPAAARFIAASVGRGSLGDPSEIAEAAVWLCSDRSSFVSGESLVVDGATVCR
jgi:NAD(P)-dependent dehydrogenase (short-subunit alcohol dehydrogenase family)